MTTVKEATKIIRALGLSVKRTDGEWRVNFPGAPEASANYTDDINDAIGTARAMKKWFDEDRAKKRDARFIGIAKL